MRMQRLAVAAMACALPACSLAKAPPAATATAPAAVEAPPVEVAQWTCEDGRTIAMAYFADPDRVDLTFGDGRRLTLPAAIAASGNLFEADGVRFHSKGMTEAYFAEGEAVTNCTTDAETP